MKSKLKINKKPLLFEQPKWKKSIQRIFKVIAKRFKDVHHKEQNWKIYVLYIIIFIISCCIVNVVGKQIWSASSTQTEIKLPEVIVDSITTEITAIDKEKENKESVPDNIKIEIDKDYMRMNNPLGYDVLSMEISEKHWKHVNIIQGGTGEKEYGPGYGFTVPTISTPFGFNHWAIQSHNYVDRSHKSFIFDHSHESFYAIRCHHQPSAWTNNWASFMIKPMVGQIHSVFGINYFDKDITMKPNLFDADLTFDNNIINLKFTATAHGGITQVHWKKIEAAEPVSPDAKDGLKQIFVNPWHSEHQESEFIFPSKSEMFLNMRGSNTDHQLFMRAYFKSNIPFKHSHHGGGIILDFSDEDADFVEIRMSTSLISKDQLKLNYETEIENQTFEFLQEQLKYLWLT